MADDLAVGDLPVTVASVAFAPGRHLGAGLRAAREFAGLSLDDISQMTRVRTAYLAALEDMDMERLPSRPFAVGYVRAYARALGLDETRTISRFRADAPAADESLPNPMGVSNEGDPRRNILILVGVVIVVSIVAWNIAQRAINAARTTPRSQAVKVDERPKAVIGAVQLSPLTPPPVEATLPPPYVTPGLEEADPVVAASIQAAAAEAALAQGPLVGQALLPRGPIQGAAAADSRLILQARASVVLIIRQAQGAVIDIKTLTEGQAYRVPETPGVLIDVSMPSSMDYYIEGKRVGPLTTPVTPVATLMKGVPPRPKPPEPVAAATPGGATPAPPAPSTTAPRPPPAAQAAPAVPRPAAPAASRPAP